MLVTPIHVLETSLFMFEVTHSFLPTETMWSVVLEKERTVNHWCPLIIMGRVCWWRIWLFRIFSRLCCGCCCLSWCLNSSFTVRLGITIWTNSCHKAISRFTATAQPQQFTRKLWKGFRTSMGCKAFLMKTLLETSGFFPGNSLLLLTLTTTVRKKPLYSYKCCFN